MILNYYFDTELTNTLIGTFKPDWTWADYVDTIYQIDKDPANHAIPIESRIDQIIDFRDALKLPDDGVGVLQLQKVREQIKTNKEIPRSGGISVFVGNPIWTASFLRTVGSTISQATVKEHTFPTIEKARDYIIQHRAKSS